MEKSILEENKLKIEKVTENVTIGFSLRSRWESFLRNWDNDAIMRTEELVGLLREGIPEHLDDEVSSLAAEVENLLNGPMFEVFAKETYPTIPPGYLGPCEPEFTRSGLIVPIHTDPIIYVDDGFLNIEMTMNPDIPIRVTCRLIRCRFEDENGGVWDQRVLQRARGTTIFFLVKFPSIGFYKLEIKSNDMPVWNYIIAANRDSEGVQFPYQSAKCTESCYLHEPLEFVLRSATKPDNLQFRLEVPMATSVVVLIDEEQIRLERENGGTWAGVVSMTDRWGKSHTGELKVGAYYPSEANYIELLTYLLR